MCVRTLGQEGALKEMATHSSILVWEIPWTEEPGRLQSMGSHRVRHDEETENVPMHKDRKEHASPSEERGSCMEESSDH